MQTLAQSVTEQLRDWILHGQVRPNARLEEVPLAEQLGVSRTPVRAALATLANEGLINHQPKRGYVVRSFDIDDIVAAYEVRSVLEGLACRSAAIRGLTEAQTRSLKANLAEGDRILACGKLRPEDHAPYQLSRSHCEIDFENGRFVLRDRGSKLGTFVNGEQICVDSGKISAELKQGENDIVFGTHGSPHHYSIFIEELK